jgi:NitT/TauT family transport system substrate-binding protein
MSRPNRSSGWRRPAAAATLLAGGALAWLTAGCQPNAASNKLKVAYLGLTCEAPIFVAKEKGFFEEEGLDAELIPTDWDNLQIGLSEGRFDANHTLIMYILKPIEKGSDIKITGGIHTGCLRVQAGVKTDIHKVEDLKGKRIGVPTSIGSPPYMFASRVLIAHGINPGIDKKEVEWLPIQPGELEKALDNGQVDAVATSDPIGTILLGRDKVRTIADQAEDEPYKDEYCCAAVVSGKLAKSDPAKAAKATRALLKAAKWVEMNPQAAAELSVDAKKIAASKEINAQALSKLRYTPGVAQCKTSVLSAAKEMKAAGLLDGATDTDKLAARAWLDLPGVDDAWLKDVKVEKVADGGRPALLSPVRFAALFDGRPSCCGACCCIGE